MVSFEEIELLASLSDQCAKMSQKAPKKMRSGMAITSEVLAHVKDVLIEEGLVVESEG